LAVGDFDNDGALDVLIANNGGAPVLLQDNAAKPNNWVGPKLEGVTCNPRCDWSEDTLTSGSKLRQPSKE